MKRRRLKNIDAAAIGAAFHQRTPMPPTKNIDFAAIGAASMDAPTLPPHRASYFDTVAINLPAVHGSVFALFRDLPGKGELLTNFRAQRRLSAGDRLLMQRLEFTTTHWSGDNLLQHLMATAQLEIRLNRRVIFAEPLRDANRSYTKNYGDEGGLEISDNDDISGSIVFGEMPRDWPAPSITEWKSDSYETTEEELAWSNRIPRRIREYLPRLRYARHTHRPVSRLMQGTTLVTVKLTGLLTCPLAL